MRRRTKPAIPKVEAKPSVARKSLKNESSTVRDLEKRLAEALKREAEALEQQTATSEILRLIADSPADLPTVLNGILGGAIRLVGAEWGAMARFDGELFHLVAQQGATPGFLETAAKVYPFAPHLDSPSTRAITERHPVYIEDAFESSYRGTRELARAAPYRSLLSLPLLREGRGIGTINLTWPDMRPFPADRIEVLKTFADQAVIAIENVRLFKELGARNTELTEALTQQTATSEVLGVISRSPTDIQPVLDTVVESAARLCEAHDASIFLRRDIRLVLAAYHGLIYDASAIARALGTIGGFTLSLDRGTLGGRTVLDARTVHIADVQVEAEEFPEASENARQLGFHTMLSVPLMREGVAIGAIQLPRTEVRPFTERQVALLRTFADQAVIAIENVRLFTELEARNSELRVALEQQTATSELLKVIGGSAFDLQPVFETLAENAVRLCEAKQATIFQFDGQLFHALVTHNLIPAHREFLQQNPIAPGRHSGAGRAALERRTIHIHDVRTDPEYTYGDRQLPYRTLLAVPMLRADELLGTISIQRDEVLPFTDSQIALMETFADQAAIAIENARLLSELQAKNADLTEALEQQTATAEILRVISSSPTDLQPVLDSVAENAARLCNASDAHIYRVEGDLLLPSASYGPVPLTWPTARRPISRDWVTGRAVVDRSTIHVHDLAAESDAEYPIGKATQRITGHRTTLATPLLRQGVALGAILIRRMEVLPFSEKQIALLQIFADQAVIAIENVRLFTELQASNRELTTALDTQTATSDILRVISQSQTDVQPVFDAIVHSALHLLRGNASTLSRVEGDQIALAAMTSTAGPGDASQRARFPMSIHSEDANAQAVRNRAPFNSTDAHSDPRLPETQHASARLRDYRSLVVVPLVRHDEAIGALGVARREPGSFTDDETALLKTFADQAVIAIENARLLTELQARTQELTRSVGELRALGEVGQAISIQNARLFHELADKSRQLEAASRHKSEFLANMSHELRTPLNAIIGFSEVLAQGMFGAINEKQTEYLKDILESGRHLLSLINDILDLSKIEAGRMELESADFDLPSAIENALILVRERASRHGIRLGSTIDTRLGTISGDERKVKQVLLNLLSNALKFTPEGGQIDVSARLHDNRAEVSVADTGIGIAPTDQDTVFEEFRQVGTADKKAEGTGLGLTLSRKFIELHGGKIWVQSELGRGSTFTFTLPVSPWPAS